MTKEKSVIIMIKTIKSMDKNKTNSGEITLLLAV